MKKQTISIVTIVIAAIVLLALFFFMTLSSEPAVVFEMDDNADTLTVVEVNNPDLQWADITLWTSNAGEAILPLPSSNITIGDVIPFCQDRIALYVTETNELLGNWTFSSEPRPTFTLYNDEINKTIEIKTIDTPNKYLWSDMDIFIDEGNLSLEFPTGYINAGDKLINVSGEGTGYFIWKPTGWGFSQPIVYFSEYVPVLEFEADETNQSISIISVKGAYNANWTNIKIQKYPKNLTVNLPTGIIEVGDKITYECNGNCSEGVVELVIMWETTTYFNFYERFIFQ